VGAYDAIRKYSSVAATSFGERNLFGIASPEYMKSGCSFRGVGDLGELPGRGADFIYTIYTPNDGWD
jgi:hypothetical protein